jgi:L,D-transpeptidase ErfK/SrfK
MRTIRAHGGGANVSPGAGCAGSGRLGASGGGVLLGAQASASAAKTSRRSRPAWRIGPPLLVALVAMPARGEPQELREPLERFRLVIGEERSDLVKPGETLLDVAFRNGFGFEAVSSLNPEVDTWVPVPGTVVRLPSRMILPDVEEEGLVINIPEMRLFDFTVEDSPEVMPVAIGDAEDPTPTGDYRIGAKRIDPVWDVPASIREEKPDLPERVPPGPGNPLGTRWMRIGETSYGIHGTDIRWSIGREATHGCVRLYEQDVRRLFDRTPEGTRLQIVYQPYKWGRDGSQILFEAHPDLYAHMPDRLAHALAPLRELGLLDRVDIEQVWRAVDELRGVPIVVGTLPTASAPRSLNRD